jgi:hypothetical protein
MLVRFCYQRFEWKDVPGVADGDGGAQQRTGHGVRAGESDGTGLFTLAYHPYHD